ncbi:MAG: IPTL-CTERM sorting domain-containing protein [Bryobacteraceae bacterium]
MFFCVTGSGAVIQNNPHGFPTVLVTPGTSTDFLSAPVNVEFPGLIICHPTGCPAYIPPGATSVPTLSEWGMIGLAGMLALFGVWRLRAKPTT